MNFILKILFSILKYETYWVETASAYSFLTFNRDSNLLMWLGAVAVQLFQKTVNFDHGRQHVQNTLGISEHSSVNWLQGFNSRQRHIFFSPTRPGRLYGFSQPSTQGAPDGHFLIRARAPSRTVKRSAHPQNIWRFIPTQISLYASMAWCSGIRSF